MLAGCMKNRILGGPLSQAVERGGEAVAKRYRSTRRPARKVSEATERSSQRLAAWRLPYRARHGET